MIMKMCCKNEMKDLIELVDDKFDLDTVFVTDFDTQTNKEYLLKQSWFVTFHNNEDELLGLLILDGVGLCLLFPSDTADDLICVDLVLRHYLKKHIQLLTTKLITGNISPITLS